MEEAGMDEGVAGVGGIRSIETPLCRNFRTRFSEKICICWGGNWGPPRCVVLAPGNALFQRGVRATVYTRLSSRDRSEGNVLNEVVSLSVSLAVYCLFVCLFSFDLGGKGRMKEMVWKGNCAVCALSCPMGEALGARARCSFY